MTYYLVVLIGLVVYILGKEAPRILVWIRLLSSFQRTSGSSPMLGTNQARVPIRELFRYCLTQFLFILLSTVQLLYMVSVIILKRLKEPLESSQPSRRHSLVSTETGKDANAGAVSLVRYIYTFPPQEFELDPNLRDHEWLLMSKPLRLWAGFITANQLLLDATVALDSGYVAARTALIDRLMSESLKDRRDSKRRYKQILILGAGFDSRGSRFRELRRGSDGIEVWVIEVDQSSVQRKKLSRLSNRLGNSEFKEITEGIEYVECNFDYDGALSHALKSSQHFDPSLPTFVLFEGVTYYLDKAAIEETLSTLSRLRRESSDPSSEWRLVFDYVDESIFFQSAPLEYRVQLEWVAIHNAPLKSGLPRRRESLEGFLNQFGVRVIQIWERGAIMSEVQSICRFHSNTFPAALANCEWADV